MVFEKTRGMAVQLADFVVTYSLQLNNRCLRYLADCDVRGSAVIGVEVDTIRPDVSVYAESLLTRDSRRVYSMWDMFRARVGDDLASHVAALGHTAQVLTGSPTHKRLALRLASIASEEAQAQTMVKIVRAITDHETMTWDGLNELFLQDSGHWRETERFAGTADELLLKRIQRNYRKGYRAGKTYTGLDAPRRGHWLDGNAGLWLEVAQHTVHQLELLRPRLSDKGKAQLWYLEKLADTLRTRVGLVELQVQIKHCEVGKGARLIGQQFVAQQIDKMDRRLERLLDSSYVVKHKRFAKLIAAAIEGDALEQVALLAVPRPRDNGAQDPRRQETGS